MCCLWTEVIYVEGGIITLSNSVKNNVNSFHVVLLPSVLGIVLTAAQTPPHVDTQTTAGKVKSLPSDEATESQRS